MASTFTKTTALIINDDTRKRIDRSFTASGITAGSEGRIASLTLTDTFWAGIAEDTAEGDLYLDTISRKINSEYASVANQVSGLLSGRINRDSKLEQLTEWQSAVARIEEDGEVPSNDQTDGIRVTSQALAIYDAR